MFEHLTISVGPNAFEKKNTKPRSGAQIKLKFHSKHHWVIISKSFHTYKEETSKKIPHLDDVVCHAVQTETLHGSLVAPKASQCKGGIVEQ